MTKLQIEKKLIAAGIDMTTVECSRDEIVVCVQDREGNVDTDATQSAVVAVETVFPGWGGHMSMAGAVKLHPHFTARNDAEQNY